MLQSKIFILLSCTYIFLRVRFLTSLVFTICISILTFFNTILVLNFCLFIYLFILFLFLSHQLVLCARDS